MSDALEHVTETQVSVGRKVQLERYEPIEEHVTHTVSFPEDATLEEKREILNAAEADAWDTAERGVMRRYEENVRDDE